MSCLQGTLLNVGVYDMNDVGHLRGCNTPLLLIQTTTDGSTTASGGSDGAPADHTADPMTPEYGQSPRGGAGWGAPDAAGTGVGTAGAKMMRPPSQSSPGTVTGGHVSISLKQQGNRALGEEDIEVGFKG